MAEAFISEIRLFGLNFAPRGWAKCEGQLIAISQNQALFSLLGTTYGGDGRTTFGLPDLRGRAPIHEGTGPGLSTYKLGQRVGAENKTLTEGELPAHSHSFSIDCSTATGSTDSPAGAVPAATAEDNFSDSKNGQMSPMQTGTAGSNQPIPLAAPRLALNFCICLQGIFPSRS